MTRRLIPYAGAERRPAPKAPAKPEPMTLDQLLLRELTEIAMKLRKLQDHRDALKERLRTLRASP